VAWAIVPEALAALVEIATRDQLTADDLALVAQQLGRPLDNSHAVELRGPVAVLPVIGPIFRYADSFGLISGGTTVETLAQDFAQALANPQVGAILLNIDSPGGEATGIAELAAQIRAARGVKPVVAYAGGDCCSAAYWLASAADLLVIDSIAQVGSIGAVMAVPNPDAAGRVATRLEFVSSQSPQKRPDPRTEGGRSQIQARVDALAGVFIAQVAANRGLSEAQVAATEGAVFVGQAAVDRGLADRLGSYEGVIAELLAAAAERRTPFATRGANGTERAARAAEMEGRMAGGFWQRFFGGLGEQMDAESMFTPAVRAAGGEEVSMQLTPPVATAATTTVSVLPVTLVSEPDPEVVALKAQLAALRAERQAEMEARLTDAAATFAAGERKSECKS
jgi:ClpP class serine protease